MRLNCINGKDGQAFDLLGMDDSLSNLTTKGEDGGKGDFHLTHDGGELGFSPGRGKCEGNVSVADGQGGQQADEGVPHLQPHPCLRSLHR